MITSWLGMVVLFHVVDRLDAARHIVVEADIQGGDDLAREREILISMAGASRVVLRLVLAALPDPPLPFAQIMLPAVARFLGNFLVFLSRLLGQFVWPLLDFVTWSLSLVLRNLVSLVNTISPTTPQPAAAVAAVVAPQAPAP